MLKLTRFLAVFWMVPSGVWANETGLAKPALRVNQSSTGYCSPNISHTGRNVTVNCYDVAPRALVTLNRLLAQQHLRLSKKIAEANDWATKYHALQEKLARTDNDSGARQIARAKLNTGDLIGAETALNEVAADTRNRIILLNIVRAAYREPPYYTDIQGTKDGVKSVPLNGAEFAKGMLQPIDPDTIQFFLSQGWGARILAPLVVQKVECKYDDQVFAEIIDAPGSYGGLATTRDFAEIHFYVGTADAKTGERNLEAMVPDSFRQECRARLFTLYHEPQFAMRFGLNAKDIASLVMRDRVSTRGKERASGPKQIALDVAFRSPDGIVLYLGERLRAKLEGAAPASAADGDILFDVDRNASGPAAVEVSHNGQRWSIPALGIRPMIEPGSARVSVNRSLEVIGLLNQLISLQTNLK